MKINLLLAIYVFISLNVFAQTDINIVRGPYLQMATQNSIIVKWRTNIEADMALQYSENTGESWIDVLGEKSIDHEINITNLKSNHYYLYRLVEKKSGKIYYQSTYYFRTLPEVGSNGKYKFLALGDAGSGSAEQLAVKNAATLYNKSVHFDGVLLLGDNAYPSGTDKNYQDYFFRYDEIFTNSVIWPTPGNHDYNNHIPFSGNPAYYDIFSCPSNGECGGLASGTEKYFAFDYGNVHFISLDSYDESRKVDAKMAQWLEKDLASTNQPWKVVYFHHPPYSKGSHNSDNPTLIDKILVDMRKNIIPILEKHHVDLVLNGHSHSYERSHFVKSHYGKSKSLSFEHILDSTGGVYPHQCPYRKNSKTSEGNSGTVYCVMGCSGKLSKVKKSWPHPVMYHSTAKEIGSLILTVENNLLSVGFINLNGTLIDQFSILKDAGKEEHITHCRGELLALKSSWPSQMNWSNGEQQQQQIYLRPQTDMIIIASDSLQCVTDTFNIHVISVDTCQIDQGFQEMPKAEQKLMNNFNKSQSQIFLEAILQKKTKIQLKN